MIEHLISALQIVVSTYGTLGLFLASFTEEVIAFIPSSIVMMSGGFLLFAGQPITTFTLFTLLTNVALPLATGLTTGSLVIYYVSYKIGQPFIERFGKYANITWSDIEKIQSLLNKSISDEFFLFFARVLPIVPSGLISLTAGVLRLPLKKYILLTFFAALIRAYAMAFIGWQAGNLYVLYADEINQYELYGLAVVIGISIGWWLTRKILKTRKTHKTAKHKNS